jgi:hypothetical protein
MSHTLRVSVTVIANLLLLVPATGCLGGTSDAPLSTGAKPPDGHTVLLPPGSYRETCVPLVTGALSTGWEDDAVFAGAMALVGGRSVQGRPEDFALIRNGRYAPWKSLLLLRKGAAAAVIVRADERDSVSLLYNKLRIRPGQVVGVRYGYPAVVFPACVSSARSEWIQFPGAMVIAGRQCAHLDVYPLDPATLEASGPPKPVSIRYGVQRCS